MKNPKKNNSEHAEFLSLDLKEVDLSGLSGLSGDVLLNNKTKTPMKEILKRKFKQSELKPRPGAGNLTSIDAYAIIDRLNEAFGETNWRVRVKETIWKENEVVVFGCLDIWSNNSWKSLSDTFGGMTQSNFSNGKAIHSKADLAKGATTALIGKSASFLGIGIEVYKGIQTYKTPDEESSETKKASPAPQKTNSYLRIPNKKWNVESFMNNVMDLDKKTGICKIPSKETGELKEYQLSKEQLEESLNFLAKTK